MDERAGDEMLEELSAVYRRHLREAGCPNATLVLLIEDLREHVVESIQAELGWGETSSEACPGCGCAPGDGLTTTCNHPQGCGFYRRITEEADNAEED